MVRLRFVQTTDSDTPGFPFMPGQEIALPEMTPQAQRWLKYHHAIVVPGEIERAVAPSVETQIAVTQPPATPAARVRRGPRGH